MLVLTRNENESIIIGQDIYVTILEVKGRQVKVGIEAPEEVNIVREEISDRTLPGGSSLDYYSSLLFPIWLTLYVPSSLN